MIKECVPDFIKFQYKCLNPFERNAYFLCWFYVFILFIFFSKQTQTKLYLFETYILGPQKSFKC